MSKTSEYSAVTAAWLGTTEYRSCLALQRSLLSMRIAGRIADTILLTEHRPVYTLGRSANADHLLDAEDVLRARGVDVVAVERGGDVTFHGPGQLVVYPILDLQDYFLDVHRYLRCLEETVIRLLLQIRVASTRLPEYAGVWIGDEKICAVGVHTSRWCTMHGLALNVNVELGYFDRIIACGIREKGVTSLVRQGVHGMCPAECFPGWLEEFSTVFEREIHLVDRAWFASVVGEAGDDSLTASHGDHVAPRPRRTATTSLPAAQGAFLNTYETLHSHND